MLYKKEAQSLGKLGTCLTAYNAYGEKVSYEKTDSGYVKQAQALDNRPRKKVMVINKKGKLEEKKVIDKGTENLYKKLPCGAIIDVRKYNAAIHKRKTQQEAIQIARLN